MEKIVKIALIILLLVCLLDMPYGYYQLVRITAFFGFTFLGLKEKGRSRNNINLLYYVLAILFQPFIKIALGRAIWNVIDVIVATGLFVTLLTGKKS